VQSELLEHRSCVAVERACAVEVVAHSLELGEDTENGGLRLPVTLNPLRDLLRAGDRLLNRHRPVHESQCVLRRRPPLLSHVGRSLRVLDRTF
jgi:hypothetical protein